MTFKEGAGKGAEGGLGLDEEAVEDLADWIAENVPPGAARGALRVGAGADGSYV